LADRLAREPPADEIDRLEVVRSDIPHVLVARHVRPVLLEYPPAVRVQLHLPHDLHPRPLQPKVEAADTAKQRSHTHLAQPLDILPPVCIIEITKEAPMTDRSVYVLTDPDNPKAVAMIQDALLAHYATVKPIAFYVDTQTVVFLCVEM
jgi:hypothetical protein